MTLADFAHSVDLYERTETEKAGLLIYFVLEQRGQQDVTVSEIADLFSDLRLPRPNPTRLRKKLQDSRNFIRGTRRTAFALHGRFLATLRASHPKVASKSEEVISTDQVLPRSLYEGTRGYIESLGRQINASYEGNIFDGCAVLMRRLLEVLLILSYQHLKIDTAIRDGSGNYIMLERVIADAKANKVLNLSRNSKGAIDVFRTLGNFSAHKIHYTARRTDIEKHILEYRALIEELLYKAGIRT